MKSSLTNNDLPFQRGSWVDPGDVVQIAFSGFKLVALAHILHFGCWAVVLAMVETKFTKEKFDLAWDDLVGAECSCSQCQVRVSPKITIKQS